MTPAFIDADCAATKHDFIDAGCCAIKRAFIDAGCSSGRRRAFTIGRSTAVKRAFATGRSNAATRAFVTGHSTAVTCAFVHAGWVPETSGADGCGAPSGLARPQWKTPPRRSGQALTEFLLVSVALLPLFLLIPLIGKYQDIATSTQLASRYLAFDTANRDPGSPPKDALQPAAQVRRRYFGQPGDVIETEDPLDRNTDREIPANRAWTNPHGGPLIRSATDVEISFGVASSTLASEGFEPAVDGVPFNLVPLAKASQAGLPSRGVFRANVAVPLVNLSAGNPLLEPFDRIDLRIARQTSVAINGWTASSPQQVQQRSGTLAAPIPALGAIETVLEFAVPVVDLANVKPPRFAQLDAWRDVVPADRLQAPATR
ncbi:MAG: hypothetical protein JWR21_1154 [Herminiimonas sp.]|nr:hypothetical protein [Herminiimonas sp.]MDB5856185.1 hypothetical protein [Herminiimonas sp.]